MSFHAERSGTENRLYRTRYIYTTKIDGVVCPPNISETVATRIMKLAHRPRIASTMIKLISKPILLPILLILVKTIQRIVADPKRKLSPPFDSADSVPSLGHPAPGSGKMLSLFTVLCDYPVCVTEIGAPVRVKRFSHSEFSSTTAAVARTMFRLDRFRNHSHSAFSWVKREFAVYTHPSCTVSTSSANVLCNRPSYVIYFT